MTYDPHAFRVQLAKLLTEELALEESPHLLVVNNYVFFLFTTWRIGEFFGINKMNQNLNELFEDWSIVLRQTLF